MNSVKQKIVFCIGLMLMLGQQTVFADDRPHRHRDAPGQHRKASPPSRKWQAEQRFDRRHEESPRPIYKHYYKPGYRFSPLPHGHRKIFVNTIPYFFFDGYFYRPAGAGYVIVESPIGAIVASLPRLLHIAHWRGEPYYIVGDTFYRRHPKGYIVVPDPGLGYRRW